jgi:hypothetical protein
MKILFIANNQTNDFLSDAVFHGLKSQPNLEVIDLHPLWYMYNNISKESLINRFHGRGFTYYAELPQTYVDRNNILDKIQNKYFDFIIYGNANRCLDLFSEVSSIYSKDKIILLDGEDEHNRPGININLVDGGRYFRRELSTSEALEFPSVLPISFAYPESKIHTHILNKEKVLAYIIPGISETFIYNDEESYFNDYKISLFAYTWRKAGWDCLRHYEILGNDCIPLFLDIEQCPDTICATLPKELLKEFYHKTGIYELYKMNEPMEYNQQRTLITNRDLNLINTLELTDDFFILYMEYLQKLKEYTIKHLTTTNLAKYILNENNI